MSDQNQPQDSHTQKQPAGPASSMNQPGTQGSSVSNPVSTGNKEHEPSASLSSHEAPVSNEVSKPIEAAPSHPEIQIPEELNKVVIKSPSSQTPQIKKEVADAGVAPAKESLPVITTPAGKITLPITYEQAEKDAKGKISDSKTWRAGKVLLMRHMFPEDLKKAA